MIRASDTPIIPLAGQLAFRFMIEPGQGKPHAPGQEGTAPGHQETADGLGAGQRGSPPRVNPECHSGR